MYHHGTTQAPYSRAGKHTFWVYPQTMTARQKWDTHTPASEYCNNHISESYPDSDVRTKPYICLGHTSKEDMSVARAEWLKNGFLVHADVNSYQFQNLSVQYSLLVPTFTDLIERIEALESKMKEMEEGDDEVIEKAFEETFGEKVEEVAKEEEAEEAETVYDVKVREAEEACCTELDYLVSAAAFIYLIFFAIMLIRMNDQKAVVLSSRELDL